MKQSKNSALKARHRRKAGEEQREPRVTKRQRDELERTIRDLDDPTRYVIRWAEFPRSSGWLFYYNVGDDVTSSHIQHATLFKRRKTAQLVADFLGELHVVERVKVGKDRKTIISRDSTRRSTTRKKRAGKSK